MPVAVVRLQELLYHAERFDWMVRNVSLHGSAENHFYHYYKGFILDTCVLLHGHMSKFMNWPVIFFHLEALLYSCEVLYIYQKFTITLYYKLYVTVDYSLLSLSICALLYYLKQYL